MSAIYHSRNIGLRAHIFTRDHHQALIFLSAILCALTYFVLASAARASLPSPDNDYQSSHRFSKNMGEISYQSQRLASLRRHASQAVDNDEPYLAVRLWRELAQAGDRQAAFRLGLYYDTGKEQKRDSHRAVYWYRKAAMAGEVHAQHNLAVAYAKGDGVSLDIHEAIKWWTRAARQGNPDSQYNLGIMYAAGEYGIKRDFDQAKHWWRKAAMHGDPMAQYNLGTLYVNNGLHDYCEATRWWKEAARNGVQQASLALRVIKTREDYHSCQ